MIKPGDLVIFKKSAVRTNHTTWLKTCAQNKTPMLVLREYKASDLHELEHVMPPWGVPLEAELVNERYFEVMCEGVDIHAFESELTKRGV